MIDPLTRALQVLADISDMDWVDSALCAEIGDDALWFPEKGQNVGAAKRICMRCEVRAECLEYALERDDHWGIWGGLSDRQRRHIKRARERDAA